MQSLRKSDNCNIYISQITAIEVSLQQQRDTIKEKDDKITAFEVSLQQQRDTIKEKDDKITAIEVSLQQQRDTIKEKDDKNTAIEVSLHQQLRDKDKTISTLQGWNKCINNYHHLNSFYI